MLCQRRAGASSGCKFSTPLPVLVCKTLHSLLKAWSSGSQMPADMADDTGRKATPSEPARSAPEKRASKPKGRPGSLALTVWQLPCMLIQMTASTPTTVRALRAHPKPKFMGTILPGCK